jgi:hypothetical protein
LEAVAALAAGGTPWQERQAFPGDPRFEARAGLVVELDLTREVEKDLHRQWLLGPGSAAFRRSHAANSRDLGVEEVQRVIAEMLILEADRGSFEEREVLALEVSTSTRWMLRGGEVALVVDYAHLSPRATRAAKHIADAPGIGGEDALGYAAVSVTQSRVAYVLHSVWGRSIADLGDRGLLNVISLPLETGDIDAAASEAIARTYHRICSFPPDAYPVLQDDGDEKVLMEPPVLDWWLEPNETRTGLTVSRDVIGIATALGEAMAGLVPDFVLKSGRPDIVLTDPLTWPAHPQRVSVVMSAAEGVTPVDSFGSGTRRWVLAALRLAEAALTTQPVPDHLTGDWWHTVSGPNTVLLVDEPEAHLHPGAAASVARWLLELAPRVAALLIATHSRDFLGLSDPLVHRVLVRPQVDPRRRELIEIGHALTELVEPYLDELGLTSADLLLLQRAIIFVEGPHDVVVLEEMLGAELRSAGARLIPVHGATNLQGLVESEIVAALGLRIGVLTDNTDTTRLRQDLAKTKEEHAVHRLLREAKAQGRALQPFGLAKRDILEYLDDEVCAEAAPEFPGWENAISACRAAGVPLGELKQFATSTYGLPLHRVDVQALARRCARRGLVPQDLKNLGRGIAAWATS